MNEALTALCHNHLRDEEGMLTTALAIVSEIKSAFGERSLDAFAAALGRHRELVGVIGAIQKQRQQFAEAAAGHLGVPPKSITMSLVLQRGARGHETSEEETPGSLAEAVSHIRGLAHELAAANYVVSVHVRVHLDAYRRILRDLTNTQAGSGRYCRAGHPESLEYRPMLQIHG